MPVRNPRRANSPSGSIGSEPRCSTAANAAHEEADTTQPASTTGEVQPSRPASTRAAVSVPSAATASTWPPRSTARGRGRVTGASRGAASSAATTNGRFRKNTPRQLHTLTSTPPTTGPLAAPTPAMAPHRPSARARSPGSVNAAWSSSSDEGTSTAAAAPAPWISRALVHQYFGAERTIVADAARRIPARHAWNMPAARGCRGAGNRPAQNLPARRQDSGRPSGSYITRYGTVAHALVQADSCGAG